MQAAAGRDVFLIFDPKSSAVFRGGIERGITKERVRSQGCFQASVEHYFLADVDGDGFIDIGVVKEELQCLEKSDADGDAIVGAFYKKHQVVWYVFKENAWKLEPKFSGKFPEHYLELPLIGIDRSPVDVIGCNLWKTCDRTKWPTGQSDQPRTEPPPEPTSGTAAGTSPVREIHAVAARGITAHFRGKESPENLRPEFGVSELWFTFDGDPKDYAFKPSGELFFSDWTFDIFSPDGAHVLLLPDHYGPYHVVAADRLKNYLAGRAKPDYVVTDEPHYRNEPARVHHDGHWVSPREIQFTVSCCGTSETITYSIPPSR